jgi:hypothetical protein
MFYSIGAPHGTAKSPRASWALGVIAKSLPSPWGTDVILPLQINDEIPRKDASQFRWKAFENSYLRAKHRLSQMK